MNPTLLVIFICFNSTLVQLKVKLPKSDITCGVKFQFYLSSIKRHRLFPNNSQYSCFNSTLVQLKDTTNIGWFVKFQSFNSTLVQLKVSDSATAPGVEYRFNSTLVQLKAVKNANKYTSKSMIYHPFILIFYKHLQSTFNS